MALFFTGKELVSIAIGIEINGAAFYDAAKQLAKDDETRKTLQYLADSERDHQKTFENMLGSVEQIQPSDVYTEEYDAYLKSLVDSAVFSSEQQAKDIAGKLGSSDEAIQTALTAEKESILFYSALKELVRRPDQQTVTSIIDEEKSHLKQLLKMKK